MSPVFAALLGSSLHIAAKNIMYRFWAIILHGYLTGIEGGNTAYPCFRNVIIQNLNELHKEKKGIL